MNTADRLAELGAEVGGIGAQSHWNTVPEIEAVAVTRLIYTVLYLFYTYCKKNIKSSISWLNKKLLR